MTRTARILLGLMLGALILGIPGVGLETRAADPSSALEAALVAVYTVVSLLTLVAFAASWKWPRVAGWCAIAAGILAAALSVLDIANVLQPQPPPPAMIVVEVALTILGLAVAWSGRRAVSGHDGPRPQPR